LDHHILRNALAHGNASGGDRFLQPFGLLITNFLQFTPNSRIAWIARHQEKRSAQVKTGFFSIATNTSKLAPGDLGSATIFACSVHAQPCWVSTPRLFLDVSGAVRGNLDLYQDSSTPRLAQTVVVLWFVQNGGREKTRHCQRSAC
jgi:hypothetical protein